MEIIESDKSFKCADHSIITLGNFDGVHLGHRRILNRIVKRANALNLPSVVYTFEPHPKKIIEPNKYLPLILTIREKIDLIASFGVDYLLLTKFTREFAAKHPNEFINNILIRQLKVKEIWVGRDFTFGSGKKGTVEYLKGIGNRHGFKVNIVPAYKKNGIIIKSSSIRKSIVDGKVKEAKIMLGRPYSLSGRVVNGVRRGRKIGFPTANVETKKELIPKNGVYAGYVRLGKKLLKGVVNIGSAPTFGGKNLSIEVHIIDFRGNIYGREIEFVFVDRLRCEKRFDKPYNLIDEIARDIEVARDIL